MNHMMQIASQSKMMKEPPTEFLQRLAVLDDAQLEAFSQKALEQGIGNSAIQEGIVMIRSLKKR